jgi:hypothetical protein
MTACTASAVTAKRALAVGITPAGGTRAARRTDYRCRATVVLQQRTVAPPEAPLISWTWAS